MDQLTEIIDRALASLGERELISTDEMADLLLDLRLAAVEAELVAVTS